MDARIGRLVGEQSFPPRMTLCSFLSFRRPGRVKILGAQMPNSNVHLKYFA